NSLSLSPLYTSIVSLHIGVPLRDGPLRSLGDLKLQSARISFAKMRPDIVLRPLFIRKFQIQVGKVNFRLKITNAREVDDAAALTIIGVSSVCSTGLYAKYFLPLGNNPEIPNDCAH